MENKVYEKGTLGWFREQAKKDGFDNIRDWQIWQNQQNKIKRYQQDVKNIDQVEKIIKENKVDIKDKMAFYRFWSKVNIKDNKEDCWDWTAHVDIYGYGKFELYYKSIRSHRMAYTLTKGQISEVLEIGHLCNNPRCCNPNHLELGDHYKNMQYMVKCGRSKTCGSILKEDQVRDIHKLYNEERCKHPGYKQWQIIEPIAKKFGIDRSQLNRIINGRMWEHVYKEFHK